MGEGAQLERGRRERGYDIARAVAPGGLGTRSGRDGGMGLEENALIMELNGKKNATDLGRMCSGRFDEMNGRTETVERLGAR